MIELWCASVRRVSGEPAPELAITLYVTEYETTELADLAGDGPDGAVLAHC